MTGNRPRAHLTERETQILQLCAEGMTDAEIGKLLNISPKTVNFHIEKLKRNFSARNRLHAVVTALRQGLIY